jgi:hypothetical protein
MACYLSHLSAYVFLAMTAGFLATIRLVQTRRSYQSVAVLCPLLPPLLLHAAIAVSIDAHGAAVRWPGIAGKLRGLGWLGLSPAPAADLVVALACASLLILASLARRLEVSRVGLAAGGVLFLSFVALGSTLFAKPRYPWIPFVQWKSGPGPGTRVEEMRLEAVPWKDIFQRNQFVWGFSLSPAFRAFLEAHCQLGRHSR